MLDVDGVLANFQKGYHQLANELFGHSIEPDFLPPTWDWLENVIGSQQVSEIWRKIRQSGSFWENLEPLITLDQIKDLRQVGWDNEIYYVTSRVGHYPRKQTERWLERWSFAQGPVVISHRKADAANALAADYTIDDKAGNVLAVYYNSPKTRKVYVLDTPYNQFSPNVMGNRVRRVSNFSSFLSDVKEGT